jgi:hypothetical protein
MWCLAMVIAFGAAMLIYSPISFRFTEMLLGHKGYVAKWEKDYAPTWLGLVLHTTALFFVVYGLLHFHEVTLG